MGAFVATPLLAGLLMIPLLFNAAAFLLGFRFPLDPDLGWHVAAGREVLAGRFPFADPFSWTMPGASWIDRTWLADASLSLAFDAGGWPGVTAWGAVLGAAACAFLLFTSRDRRAAAAAATLAFAAANWFWGARLQTFTALYLAATLALFERVRRGGSFSGALALHGLTALLWANSHGGAILGPAAALAYSAGARERRARIFYLSAALVSAASLLATPAGFDAARYAFGALESPSRSYIAEWRSPDWREFIYWPLLAYAALLGILFRKRRPDAGEAAIFLVTLAGAVTSARHVPVFAVANVPALARRLEGAFDRRLARAALAAVLLLALCFGALRAWHRFTFASESLREAYPAAAIDFLGREGLLERGGFNDYDWGGYLVHRGVPVFVDGRERDAYGGEFMEAYWATLHGRVAPDGLFSVYRPAWVLVRPERRLAARLDDDPAWTQVFSDPVAVVYVRREAH